MQPQILRAQLKKLRRQTGFVIWFKQHVCIDRYMYVYCVVCAFERLRCPFFLYSSTMSPLKMITTTGISTFSPSPPKSESDWTGEIQHCWLVLCPLQK